MNQAAKVYNLPYEIIQRKKKWYVMTPWGVKPFFDRQHKIANVFQCWPSDMSKLQKELNELVSKESRA